MTLPRFVTMTSLMLSCAISTNAQVSVPAELEVEEFASGLTFVTGLAFDGNGVLYASEANIFTGTGRVLRIEDRDEDGVAETVEEFASDLSLVTGIVFRGEGFPIASPACPSSASSNSSVAAGVTDLERIRRGDFRGRTLELFVSHFEFGGPGSISILRDHDGDGIADEREDIVSDLPSDGDNGNQQLAVGPDGAIYFGQGARTNSGVPGPGPADGPLNAAILRVEADGSDLSVYANGLRNAYDLAFTPDGQLLATENGPDASGPGPVIGAPDELNAIEPGEWYGWPEHFGFPPSDTGSLAPLALFASGSSADGLAFVTPEGYCGLEGDLVIAQFGSFSDPDVPRRLVQVRLVGARGLSVSELASGFGRPLDVAFGPDGALYVADFSSFSLTPGSGAIYRIRPRDTDGDGTSDLCEPTSLTK